MRFKLAALFAFLLGMTALYLIWNGRGRLDVLRVLGAIDGAAIEDDRVNQEIVRLRYGLAVNNDPVHHAIVGMRGHLTHLDRERQNVRKQVPGFDAHLEALHGSFSKKEELAIEIASLTGSLINSRRAIGRIDEQLRRCTSTPEDRSSTETLQLVLQYALLEDDEFRRRAVAELDALESRRPLANARCDALLGGFLAHSRVILSDQPAVTEDLRVLTALPTREAIGLLLEDAWQYEKAERATIQRLSVGLLVMAVALALAVYGLFGRVERNRRLLQEARDSLEVTVLERTEELRRTNAQLERDIADRERAERQRDEMQERLQQAKRLEAVGQLAAGVAHEINTPIQFVTDSVRFVQDSMHDLVPLIERHRAVTRSVLAGAPSLADAAQTVEAEERADLAYALENVPGALSRSLAGLDQVATIVRSMKEFSHPGSKEMQPSDLNRAIGNTVVVARNEWKYVADVETDFDPDLVPVPCLIGELNQAILNMVVNAAHAIGTAVGESRDRRGMIRISTRREQDWAVIRISDDGCGMPPEVRERIFEPFFTTKEVGKGTGQGMSIAHAVVVRQHGGAIDVDSEVGRGTTITIRLPLVRERAALEDAGAPART